MQELEKYLDWQEENKDNVLTALHNKYGISKQQAEALIWDYLCTADGWNRLTADLETILDRMRAGRGGQ